MLHLCFFPLLLKLVLTEHLLCSRYRSSSLYVLPHLILHQPYKVRVIIIVIPIFEKKKLRPEMVLNLAEATQPGRGELAHQALEFLSAFLPLRELGPVPFPFLEDHVFVRGEGRRSQLHLVFPPSSAKST